MNMIFLDEDIYTSFEYFILYVSTKKPPQTEN